MNNSLRKLKKLFNILIPPDEWKFPVLLLIGIFCGVILLILRISNAWSYLSSDPQACINCHVMYPQYETWARSSHARAALCVDCHVPHDNVVRKYYFKMKDGSRHSMIYTLHQEPQVIQIKSEGKGVVQENCIRCHENVLQDVSIHQTTYEGFLKGEGKLCWDCHREVPHGRVNSLSSTSYIHVPTLSDELPSWLKKFEPVVEKMLNQ